MYIYIAMYYCSVWHAMGLVAVCCWVGREGGSLLDALWHLSCTHFIERTHDVAWAVMSAWFVGCNIIRSRTG